jgi:hypothetical protein
MAKRDLDLNIFLQNPLQNIEDIVSGDAHLFVDVNVKKTKCMTK